MQCRSCHLGNILFRDWKIDPDTVIFFPTSLTGKAQNGVRDTPFHFFRRHLTDTRVGFFEPFADCLDRVHCKTGVLLDKIIPKLGWPGQYDAFRHGNRCTG